MRSISISARYDDSDALLYDGVPVNVIEGEGPELLAPMKAQGKNSPVDVFLTVNAGNLWLADKENLFQPAQSKSLDARIPPRSEARRICGSVFPRARLIFVNAKRADPNLKGKICMRSSGGLQSVTSRRADRPLGKTEQWVKGVMKNFARSPQGAGAILFQSMAAGEGAVTIANHYYFVGLETSKSKAERDAAAKLTPIFPNQEDRGTQVNTSGGDMIASAPHKGIAVKFLEYMASDAAQNIIANANCEFPAVASVSTTPELKALGRFKIDPLNVSVYGENQAQARVIFDRAGWR